MEPPRRSIEVRPRSKLIILAVVTTVIVVSLAGVALAAGPWSGNGANGQNERGRIAGATAGTSTASLTAAEQEQILFMREEEKLARDVYTFLYEKWGVKEFQSIAASESRHMSRVKMLVDRYGLQDPVGTDVPGAFVNDELQAAYDSLVAQGSLSVQEAYKVGVTIEELDIADLQEALESTKRRDVTRVFQNLLRGSQNHLAAFTRLLEQ